MDYFPRSEKNGLEKRLDDGEIAAVISERYKALNGNAEYIGDALKLAEASLEEVKGQTEYQDVKATRLLTVVSFLAAFGGLLITRILEPLAPAEMLVAITRLAEHHAVHNFVGALGGVLGFTSNILFGLFALFAASGALVTFHATRTRFRYDLRPQRDRVRSFLFFRAIVDTEPAAWAGAFVPRDGDDAATDLKRRYLGNYVLETYLVATKVADKLRYLDPAQRLLGRAIVCLVLWLIAVAGAWVLLSLAEAIAAPGESASMGGGR